MSEQRIWIAHNIREMLAHIEADPGATHRPAFTMTARDYRLMYDAQQRAYERVREQEAATQMKVKWMPYRKATR